MFAYFYSCIFLLREDKDKMKLQYKV
jgi:hypothetical protein